MLRVNQAYVDALTDYQESVSERLETALFGTRYSGPARETPKPVSATQSSASDTPSQDND